MRPRPVDVDGFSYVPDFLSQQEQDLLLQKVRGLEFQHDSFQINRRKRGLTEFGPGRLGSSALQIAPEFPPFLRDVLKKVRDHCPHDQLDHCAVAKYTPGTGIGWHTDPNTFGECVAGVSLGALSRFQIRVDANNDLMEMSPAPGSLYVLRGPARWKYRHRVVPVDRERYSLTFRQRAQAAPGRPLP